MMTNWMTTPQETKRHALGKTTKNNPFLTQDEEEYETAQAQGDLEDEAELPF